MLLVIACDDVFEADLSGQKVTILAPNDHFTTSNSTITFWWNELEDAELYRLQIVSDNFSSITTLWLDTLISDHQFNYNLPPGDYEWRIRPENYSSVGSYRTRSLTIQFNDDLSSEIVQLLSPSNRDTTNQEQGFFSWSSIAGAENYRVELWSPTINGTQVFSIETEYDTLHYQLEEGAYEWRVRAQNDFTNSAYSTRSLFLDTTSPGIPLLTSPINNAVQMSSTIQFQWNRANDNGSSIRDSIYIYSDSTLQNRVVEQVSVTKSHTDSLGTGIYYWHVRSVDKAENKGDFSSLQKFTVN